MPLAVGPTRTRSRIGTSGLEALPELAFESEHLGSILRDEHDRHLVELEGRGEEHSATPSGIEPALSQGGLQLETLPADRHPEVRCDHLEAVLPVLEAVEPWAVAALESAVSGYVDEHAGGKLGRVAQPLRVAMSGGTVSPPIDRSNSML